MRVLVFGTFDGLHPGHLDFFRQARALGDELFVVVARDETVQMMKNHPTAQDEQTRLARVQAVSFVANARLGQSGDKYAVIEEIKPAIIALGYDQSFFTDGLADELARRGLSVRIVRLKPYEPDRYKSSLLRAAKP
ncbi:MAG: FAD synthase [Parcubacteria group bacterium]|nr:FAD synthase [Parcubacteria group bacterium]